MPEKHIIVGIHITDRLKNATAVQQIFTTYGCCIRTRLGLHDTGEGFCSPSGVLLIDFIGGEDKLAAMKKELAVIEGIETKTMIFDHP